MDFATVIGSSVHLAKQLELRWFYRWDRDASPPPRRRSAADVEVEDDDDDDNDAKRIVPAQRTATTTNRPTQSNADSPDSSPSRGTGRLVRKRLHSMPFLRRNIVGRNAGGPDGCGYGSSRPSDAGVVDDDDDDDNPIRRRDRNNEDDDVRHGAARKSPPRAARKVVSFSAEAPPQDESRRRSAKRKRGTTTAAGGKGKGTSERDSDRRDHSKRVKSNTASQASSSSTVDGHRSDETASSSGKNSATPPSSSLPPFPSYARSSAARRRVLQRVPVELHHDEEFVVERMREAWLGETGGQDDRQNSHFSGTSGEGRDIGSAFADDADDEGATRDSGDNASYVNATKHRTINGDCVSGAANASMILTSKDAFPSMDESGYSRLGSTPPSRSRSQLPPAYFHYVHMQPDNVVATFVEEIDGRVCPFCGFDAKSNEGLLDHCGRYHGTLIDSDKISSGSIEERGCAYFEAALGEEGQFHVIVRGIPTISSHATPSTRVKEDFVFVSRRPRKSARKLTGRSGGTIPFLLRRRRDTAALDETARSKKLLALQANGAPASAIAPYLPTDAVPVRRYFHARTNLPMSGGEWEVDSDGEADDAWLREMGAEMLDEFEDVSGREKAFMKLWNGFVRRDSVIADRDLPGMCHEFVKGHRERLARGGLRLNLLLHLFNLWDSGVISSNRIISSMAIFDGAGAVANHTTQEAGKQDGGTS